MKKFTTGAIAGATSLAVAVPLLAQMAGAASGDEVFIRDAKDMPAPSQECVQALAAKDAKELSVIDEHTAAHKAALQAHESALTVAASIADEDERKAAVLAADKAMHEAMKASMETMDPKADMEALKAACGDSFRFAMHTGPGGPGGHMGMMKMHGGKPGMLLEKLGMTPEELKAALESGKTIEDIAAEKGIELPKRVHTFEMHLDDDDTETDDDAPSSSASSVQ
jgi:hypothetical protein